MPTQALSLNAAAVLTGRSLRTWQRRIEAGRVPRLGLGGGRAMVPFAAVQPLLPVTLSEDEVGMLLRADGGEAVAQAEMGALLALAALREAGAAAEAGKPEPVTGRCGSAAAAARYFLLQAARQGEADAMHWLAILHAAGLAGRKPPADGASHAEALMWMAKAAAHGHEIARQQVADLMAANLQKE